ncbi:hypothetical protein V8C86DRAFT_2847409, partial [Haematococcus lacustris]
MARRGEARCMGCFFEARRRGEAARSPCPSNRLQPPYLASRDFNGEARSRCLCHQICVHGASPPRQAYLAPRPSEARRGHRRGGGTPFWELPPPQRRQLASLNDTLKNLSQEQYTMLESVMGSDPATEPPVSVSGGVKTTVTKRGQKSMADDEDGLDEEEREAEEISIVRNTPGLMSKDYNSVAGHQALRAMGAKKRKTEETGVDFAAIMSKNMEALKHTGLLSSATKRLTSLSKNLQCMRHLLIKAT